MEKAKKITSRCFIVVMILAVIFVSMSCSYMAKETNYSNAYGIYGTYFVQDEAGETVGTFKDSDNLAVGDTIAFYVSSASPSGVDYIWSLFDPASDEVKDVSLSNFIVVDTISAISGDSIKTSVGYETTSDLVLGEETESAWLASVLAKDSTNAIAWTLIALAIILAWVDLLFRESDAKEKEAKEKAKAEAKAKAEKEKAEKEKQMAQAQAVKDAADKEYAEKTAAATETAAAATKAEEEEAAQKAADEKTAKEAEEKAKKEAEEEEKANKAATVAAAALAAQKAKQEEKENAKAEKAQAKADKAAAKEQAKAEKQAEKERIAKEKEEEKARIAKEKEEAAKAAAVAAAALAAKKAEEEKAAKEAEEKRLAEEKAEKERLAKEAEERRIEEERIAAEKAEADRLAKIEADRIAKEKAEAEAKRQREERMANAIKTAAAAAAVSKAEDKKRGLVFAKKYINNTNDNLGIEDVDFPEDFFDKLGEVTSNVSLITSAEIRKFIAESMDSDVNATTKKVGRDIFKISYEKSDFGYVQQVPKSVIMEVNLPVKYAKSIMKPYGITQSVVIDNPNWFNWILNEETTTEQVSNVLHSAHYFARYKCEEAAKDENNK